MGKAQIIKLALKSGFLDYDYAFVELVDFKFDDFMSSAVGKAVAIVALSRKMNKRYYQ